MKLAVGARTDVGRVREANEDSYFVQAPLFVVADGMGGHIAGDVASATAVEVVQNQSARADASDPESLAAIVRDANSAIYEKAAADQTLHGMGTTCTLLMIDGANAQFAHVGDSRAYLLRNGQLRQVTEDHTLVGRMVAEGRLQPEEAEHHPQRSIITRALGVDADIDVDLISLELADDDRILLCSDGLNAMVGAPEIQEVLAHENDPQKAADQLVERAIAAGGEDNITVVVVHVGAEQRDAAPAAPPSASTPSGSGPAAGAGYHRAVEVTPRRRRWPRLAIGAAVVVLLLAGGGYAAARYALANSWFVGVNDDGQLTIFRGIPDDVAGLTLKEEEKVSGVDLESLPDFKRDEVRDGIRVDSLAEAEATLDNLTRLAEDTEFHQPSKGRRL